MQGRLFIKQLCTLDCAVFSRSEGIIGCSWVVDLEAEGYLDENGFVFDFSELKKLCKTTLKESLDHALIIPASCPGVTYQELNGQELWSLNENNRLEQTDFTWEYSCPKGAAYPIGVHRITPSILERETSRILRHRLPDTVSAVRIHLREESIGSNEAKFRYTHGLPQHKGLCQRLFHGHRSRLEVYVDDDRRGDLEHFVARDILSSLPHVYTDDQVDMSISSEDTLGLRYEGSYGTYGARIPRARGFRVPQSTSIESITTHIANLLREKEGHRGKIRVMICEGIGKGALAYT